MKHLAILSLILVTAFGCATPNPPHLDRVEALRIGTAYAHQEGWDVKNVWDSVTFDPSTREWQMFFDVDHIRGPKIVYVNDDSKRVRYVQGE